MGAVMPATINRSDHLYQCQAVLLEAVKTCLGPTCAGYQRAYVGPPGMSGICSEIAVHRVGGPRKTTPERCQSTIVVDLAIDFTRCCFPTIETVGAAGEFLTLPDPDHVEEAYAAVETDVWTVYCCLLAGEERIFGSCANALRVTNVTPAERPQGPCFTGRIEATVALDPRSCRCGSAAPC